MADWLEFIDGKGQVLMCERCRLVQKVNDPYRWSLIAGWYNEPPENVEFVVCPNCKEE